MTRSEWLSLADKERARHAREMLMSVEEFEKVFVHEEVPKPSVETEKAANVKLEILAPSPEIVALNKTLQKVQGKMWAEIEAMMGVKKDPERGNPAPFTEVSPRPIRDVADAVAFLREHSSKARDYEAWLWKMREAGGKVDLPVIEEYATFGNICESMANQIEEMVFLGETEEFLQREAADIERRDREWGRDDGPRRFSDIGSPGIKDAATAGRWVRDE